MKKEKNEDKDLLRELIENRFSETGEDACCTLKTSAELAREFSSFMEVTAKEVTKILLDMKTEIVDLDGKPYWKLYTKS